MTQHNPRAAEIVMAHIYGWTDGKQNTADIKFSRGALISAVNMVDDSISILVLKATLDHLVATKHLKKLGRHIYGLGTGKGLKRYPVNDQSLLHKPHNPGFNNKNNKNKLAQDAAAPTIASSGKKTNKAPHVTLGDEVPAIKPPAPAAPTPKDTVIASEAKQSSPSAENNALQDKHSAVIKQVGHLRRCLNGRFQNIAFKTVVLEHLADALKEQSPDLAETLIDIKNDLQQGEAA